MSETRRDVLKKIGSGILTAAAAIATAKKASARIGKAPMKSTMANPLSVRMEAELKESINRVEKRWIMVIDLKKCVGCYTCTVACNVENKLPPGVIYRDMKEEEFGKYPNVSLNIIPRPCLQCDNPPCVRVCPVRATWKSADGIVEVDYMRCVGCRYCIVACPYGARVVDLGRQTALTESPSSYEYNKEWIRQAHRSPVNNIRKCHFCKHRIAEGLLPACVANCIGIATYFGDRMNPDSLVSELIKRQNVVVLKKGLGTKPAVYYLV
jgi:molybdopterin-containing oxidoreductase family iron-sulfur binding subunit